MPKVISFAITAITNSRKTNISMNGFYSAWLTGFTTIRSNGIKSTGSLAVKPFNWYRLRFLPPGNDIENGTMPRNLERGVGGLAFHWCIENIATDQMG